MTLRTRPAPPGQVAGPGEYFVPLMTPEEAAAATYHYTDGTVMRPGDLVLVTWRSGVWRIAALNTFDVNGRQYASLISTDGRQRTAADLHELRLMKAADTPEEICGG